MKEYCGDIKLTYNEEADGYELYTRSDAVSLGYRLV